MKVRSLVGFLLVFSIVFLTQEARAQTASPAASNLKKTTLLVNFTLFGREAPFYASIEKGYFKEAGLDVEILPGTGSGFVGTTVDAGKAEYGMMEAGTLVQSVSKGMKIKAFMAFVDVSLDGLASLKEYPTPQSLLGAKIAAGAADSALVELPIVLQVQGLDPTKIQWQTAASATLMTLMVGGQADLYSSSLDTSIPSLTKLVGPQGKKPYFFSYAKWGYDALGFLLVAKNDRITGSPAEVKAFATAIAKGMEFSLVHPEDAVDMMLKHTPTLDREVTLAQWKLTAEAIQSPYMKQHGYGVVTMDRVQKTIDLAKKAFTLDHEVKPEEIYTEGFIAAAK